MNKAEFGILIEHPENLGKSHVAALKNIIADFPYFQAPSAMLAKALFNDKHYEFEKQLRSTALIVPDREVLYRYINDIKAPEKSSAFSSIPQADIPPVITETTPKEQKPEEQPVSLIPPPPAEVIEPVREQEIIAEEKPVIIPVAETTTVIEEEIAESPDTVNGDMRLESHSFSEWLALSQGHKMPAIIHTDLTPNAEANKEAPLNEQASEAEVPLTEAVNIEPQVPGEEKKAKSNIRQFENILDKFISDSPSISRPKAEFYNPANMAKQSVDQDEDLVTETLANIYYKQGHHKKAIRAYEKLCLIYPHKMAYFADLIQKIKKEIKD